MTNVQPTPIKHQVDLVHAQAVCRATISVTGSTINSCTCNVGFTGPNGLTQCTACAVGTYKSSSGPNACTLCADGKTTLETGASTDTCVCSPGWTDGGGGVCNQCVAGKYKDITGPSVCLECLAGNYNSMTAGTICHVCLAGNYAINKGSTSCNSCAENTYSTMDGAALASDCIACPSANSYSPSASNMPTDCQCNAGSTGPDGGTCTQCIAGKYNVATGDALYTNCNTGHYSTTVGATSDVCQTCPANANAPEASDEQTDCTCNSGSTGFNGVACTECIAGKYKVPTGEVACTNCMPGQYSTAVGAPLDVCQGCPSKSNSPEASDEQTDCTCNSGSTGSDGNICTECSAGKYKPMPGNSVCINCVAGQYSGMVGATSDVCQNCVAGKSTNNQVGQIQEEDCISCVAGKYTEDFDGNKMCDECPVDTFSNMSGATSSLTCTLCASAQVSVAGANKCTSCQDGQYKPTDFKTCEVCLVKHFCSDGLAIMCDEHLQTVPIGRSARDC